MFGEYVIARNAKRGTFTPLQMPPPIDPHMSRLLIPEYGHHGRRRDYRVVDMALTHTLRVSLTAFGKVAVFLFLHVT